METHKPDLKDYTVKITSGHPEYCLSIILNDCLAEYPITKEEYPMVSIIRDHFVCNDAEEYLELTMRFTNEEINELIPIMLRKSLLEFRDKAYHPNGQIVLVELIPSDTNNSPSGTFYELVFWNNTESELLRAIESFLDTLRSKALDMVASASGDDDYFDYVPGFVDTYRQACLYFGCEANYLEFVENLDEEFVDNALYSKTC